MRVCDCLSVFVRFCVCVGVCALLASQLVDLTGLAYDHTDADAPVYRGMYPSVGGSDEFIRLFLFRKEVSVEEMRDLQGKLTGCIEEGEVISLQVCGSVVALFVAAIRGDCSRGWLRRRGCAFDEEK